MVNGQDTDFHRIRRQIVFLRALIARSFDFRPALKDPELVRITGKDPFPPLARVGARWHMQLYDGWMTLSSTARWFSSRASRSRGGGGSCAGCGKAGDGPIRRLCRSLASWAGTCPAFASFVAMADTPTIARIWRGRTLPEKADAYEAYNYETGIKPLIEKALGVQTFREDAPTYSEFVTISYWESIEAMSRFTGGGPTQVHHLDRDAEFLIELPTRVQVLRLLTSHGDTG